jgi:hypothetical protein
VEKQQFDDLARKIGETTSRRGALRALLGAAAGGIAAMVGVGVGGSAEAATTDCCPSTYPRLCKRQCVNYKIKAC